MELDIYSWLLVFLRVGAFLLVLPFFSAANFPVQMRVALAALIALLLAPLLAPMPPGKLDFISLLCVMFNFPHGVLRGGSGRQHHCHANGPEHGHRV
jgi:flagellar biosynthetic protein FliR